MPPHCDGGTDGGRETPPITEVGAEGGAEGKGSPDGGCEEERKVNCAPSDSSRMSNVDGNGCGSPLSKPNASTPPAAASGAGAAKESVVPGTAPSGMVSATCWPDGVSTIRVSPGLAPGGTTSSKSSSFWGGGGGRGGCCCAGGGCAPVVGRLQTGTPPAAR